MKEFQWRLYKKILHATWLVFGFSKEFLRAFCIMPVRVLLIDFLLALDNLFFPQFLTKKIKNPLFIIGHPRSGTTFLHRLLASAGRWESFRYWHLLIPSLTGRVLLAPVFQWLIRHGKDVIYPKEVGHELRLDSFEEDELLFLHLFNTQFMAVTTAWGLGDEDFDEVVFWDRQPEDVRKHSMQFYKECLQRQLTFTQTSRLACNANYSGMRLRSILEVFPDARIVYLVRSPLETIPSHLSLHQKMFFHRFGKDRIPKERLQRYFMRRYWANVVYYLYIETLFKQGILHGGNCLVVTYEELTQDLENVGRRIAAFCGVPYDGATQQAFAEAARLQPHYKRAHQNVPLESFGLRTEDIVRDLRYVLEKYGWMS